MLRYTLSLLIFLFPALLTAQSDAERAAQFIASGRFAEAKPITDRLLQRATSTDHADALTDIGIALEDSGRYREAEPFHHKGNNLSLIPA